MAFSVRSGDFDSAGLLVPEHINMLTPLTYAKEIKIHGFICLSLNEWKSKRDTGASHFLSSDAVSLDIGGID